MEKGTDRPLAGVAIRFSEEPDAPTATTDDQGRFDGLPTVGMNNIPRDGQPGPTGRVRAEGERAWPWEVVEPDIMVRYPPGYLRKQAIETLYRRVETRWRGTGAGGSLVVECPPIGVIEAVVRGPDGLPLADRAILVFPEADSPGRSGVIHLSGRTDQAGAFRLPSFEDVRQITVHVPGLGFGSTGRVAVSGGKVAQPEIPPLARFARVEGRLDPSLNTPGTKAALFSEPFQRPTGIVAPCDEQGRFALADVIPGAYRVVAQRGGQNVPTVYRFVQPEPGQVLGDVVLESQPPPTPEARRETERTLRQLNGDRNKTITWLEGTIRDEKGQPIPGAMVYLHFEYSGGIRMMEEVKGATADERGHYKFDGPLYPSMGTLTVVASAKGRPPAIAFSPGPDDSAAEGDPKPARLDVTLGSTGASANVAVVQDGKPLPGVAVRLSSRGAVALSSPFYVGRARGGERGQVEELVSPTAKTGADGVARFENLLPGAFELIASASPDPAQLLQVRWPRNAGLAFGIAEGVAAPPGGKVETTIAVHRQPGSVRFRLLKPDGSPVVGQSVAFSFGPGRAQATTSLKIDERGIGSHDFEHPGLWAVEFKFRDSELKSFPIREEPYYVTEALIPVSPGIDNEDPVTLRSVRRDRGSIRARLLDEAGKPVRGTVMIVDDGRGMVRQAGTVDADGAIRFADLSSGKYRLRGVVEGQTSAPRPRAGVTRLDDAGLRGQTTVFDREVTLAPGAEATVDLRREPVGYVRVALRAPAGRNPADYTVQLQSDLPTDRNRDFESDVAAGTYLFGPMRVGQWPIVLRERIESGPYPVRGERPVVVEPGQVVRAEVEPDLGPARPKAPKSRQQAFLGMGGISLIDSGPEGFSATVFLPDGTTPAFGARALFFPADGRGPTAEGITDGSGRLTWTGRWRSQPDGDEAGPTPVKEPTIAAWMPGLAGPVVAVVVPDKPLRLVLPAPAGASGRVTLGGRGGEGRNARVRVVAVPEKQDVLAIASGHAATADPDGRFRFAGLAPGRYLVQAARDSLWLSASVPVVIEPGKDADPIALDIPEPGAPVVLDLVDARGRPIPDLSFAIRQTEGPLARTLTMTYRTDERGSAIVRGLEAGSHSFVADGDPEPHAFAVPPARPGAAPRSVRIQVALPQP